MSLNENPHAGACTIKAAANPAATALFIFMSVFSLSCEGSYTRRGASPGFRLRASSASFAGPPGPTGQRGFVSGYSCATAPDFHGIPFSQSQKRRVLYAFPRQSTSRKRPNSTESKSLALARSARQLHEVGEDVECLVQNNVFSALRQAVLIAGVSVGNDINIKAIKADLVHTAL